VPTLNAFEGQIHLESVGSAGEVVLPQPGQPLDREVGSVARAGTVRLIKGARIDVSTEGTGRPAGRVRVVARDVRLEDRDTRILARTRNSGDGGEIAIHTDTLTLLGPANGVGGPHIDVSSQNPGTGRGGRVIVVARDVRLEGGESRIAATTNNNGAGGKIAIHADTLTLIGVSSQIDASTAGTGSAGRVIVVARDVRLDGGRILAGTSNRGDGGKIDVQASRLTLTTHSTGNAEINASTESEGAEAGRGGHVRVVARDVLLKDSARIWTRAKIGDGGVIKVRAGTLTLTGEAEIGATSLGTGRGGNIAVQASEALMIVGQGTSPARIASDALRGGDAGRVFVSAPTMRLDNGRILAVGSERGSGRGGEVEVRGDMLTLTRGATISSGVSGVGNGGTVTVVATQAIRIVGSGIGSGVDGGGEAGQVFVSAPTVRLEAGGSITAAADRAPGTGAAGRGDGGTIAVQAGTLTLTGGAEINARTQGAGTGGTVTVRASEAIVIAGQRENGTPSRVITSTQGRGQGGNIHVQAKHIELRDRGTIEATSSADGPAGTIRIQAEETFRSDHGQVTTASARAGGGTIALTAGKWMQHLNASEITTSVQGGETDAGNLTINAPFTILKGSSVRANAFGGNGGNIQIRAQQGYLADPASQVSASSNLGINGPVTIQAASTPSGLVAPIPLVLAPAAVLLRSPCAARLHAGTVSTLVERGRAGVPATPDGVLPSRLPLAPLDMATPTHAGGLPSAALVSPLVRSQRDPSESLPRQGWAAPADSLRLLSDCASR
jgi:large exoprotein involved in heme utilization and adhesion